MNIKTNGPWVACGEGEEPQFADTREAAEKIARSMAARHPCENFNVLGLTSVWRHIPVDATGMPVLSSHEIRL